MSETSDVRPGDELECSRLDGYLRERLPDLDGTLSVRQFTGGHANLVYLLRFGEREFVLRRPPPGPLPKGAHDMVREYRVLSVLYRAYPLAPRAFVLCTDHSIIGADFVVEERRSGAIVRGEIPPEIARVPARCRALGKNFIDALAALHSVDYERLGLASLGRPQGYLARQVRGWCERWRLAATGDQPDARGLIAYLEASLPTSGPPAIVHNDFKFDNTIFDARDHTVPVAVLDWDMCTIGDPLADLGNVLALWTQAGDPPPVGSSIMQTAHPGFPTRDELVERYARSTGRDCRSIAWYRDFNLFRYAVIAQQLYARFRRGQTTDDRFAELAAWVATLIARAGA